MGARRSAMARRWLVLTCKQCNSTAGTRLDEQARLREEQLDFHAGRAPDRALAAEIMVVNGNRILTLWRQRRFLAVVATPDRFGSCDGTPGTGGAAASREAGAVRAADRAGVQQPGGVPDRRDQPADRET